MKKPIIAYTNLTSTRALPYITDAFHTLGTRRRNTIIGGPLDVALARLRRGGRLAIIRINDLGATEDDARRVLRDLRDADITLTVDGATFDLTRVTGLRAINLLLQASRGLLWMPSAEDLTTTL